MENTKLTSKQQQILDCYMEIGSKRGVAKEMGISDKYVRVALKACESKGQAPWLTPAVMPEHLKMVKHDRAI
jgi:hypothetical protein